MKGRGLWIGAVIAAFFQTAVLGVFVEGRAAILRHGEEIILKTVPVDPRDLLRGHYVTLAYDISRLDSALFRMPDNLPERLPRDIFVLLSVGEGDDVTPKAVFFKKDIVPDEGERLIKARLAAAHRRQDIKSGKNIEVTYGIERFYVAEEEALKIENASRDQKIPVAVVVALSKGGKMQIKRLLINGKTAYQEPLY